MERRDNEANELFRIVVHVVAGLGCSRRRGDAAQGGWRMSDHEQTGPLWTDAARAECERRNRAQHEIPCWLVSGSPCDACRIAERDALAQLVAALEAERGKMAKAVEILMSAADKAADAAHIAGDYDIQDLCNDAWVQGLEVLVPKHLRRQKAVTPTNQEAAE
jgi:hypothetical protein